MDEYNKLGEFSETIPGSNYQLKDIDSSISGVGDLTELYDIDVIVMSINRILKIQKGTYIDDPEFGVGLERFLFEPSDSKTLESIKKEVKSAIANYERRARISVDINFFNNMKGFQINIKIVQKGLVRYSKINITEDMINSI